MAYTPWRTKASNFSSEQQRIKVCHDAKEQRAADSKRLKSGGGSARLSTFGRFGHEVPQRLVVGSRHGHEAGSIAVVYNRCYVKYNRCCVKYNSCCRCCGKHNSSFNYLTMYHWSLEPSLTMGAHQRVLSRKPRKVDVVLWFKQGTGVNPTTEGCGSS